MHPTVIMKSDFLRRNNLQYNEKMKDAEDYDLWVRAAKYGTIKGINKVLLKYRWSEGQVSQRASESMRYTETRISHRQLESILGRKMDNEESEAFYKFRHYQSTMDFKTMDRLLGEALKKNKKKRVFNQELLKHYFAMYWLIIMRKRIVSKDTKDILCLGQTLRALNPWNIYFSVLHKRREKYGRED